tara:strand:- start:1626 stop:2822 length:1197 start_codon:yes stop_codon:yes gene_type:complete
MEEIFVPFEENTFSDPFSTSITYLESGMWVPLPLEVETNKSIIKISAEWEKSDTKQTVGIFTSIEDLPVEIPGFNGKHTYNYGKQEKGILLADKWVFGSKATIEMSDLESSENKKFDLLLRCNPIFKDVFDSSVLNVRLHVKNKYGIWDIHDEHKLIFKPKDSVEGQNNGWLLEEFYNMQALNTYGKGNSIHPKQIVTIRGLEKVMENFSSEKLNIAYIGVDTSENLRSIIRFLSGNQKLAKRISSFTVYATKFWDDPLLDLLDREHCIDGFNINPGTKIEIIKLEHDSEKLPTHEKMPKAEIVIATFVTPWVLDSKTENQIQYKKLLKKIMTSESTLISTDPTNSECAVRSKIEHKQLDTNLTKFYKVTMEYDNPLDPEPLSFAHSVSQKFWRESEK